MQASGHRTGGNMTCATCHDAHIPHRYAEAAGSGLTAIHTECSTCHADKTITVTTPGGTYDKPVDCVDCHMSKAAKSALGTQFGNGWEGDVPSHLWQINTDAVTREAMFNEAGDAVLLDGDGHGSVTLDFACLKCHQSEDVTWASSYAENIHDGITVGINDNQPQLAGNYKLNQNYPNPFNPTTNISYFIPKNGQVTLEIFDIAGRNVRTLVSEFQNADNYEVTWNAKNKEGQFVPSGVYFYSLRSNSFTSTRKMVYVK